MNSATVIGYHFDGGVYCVECFEEPEAEEDSSADGTDKQEEEK